MRKTGKGQSRASLLSGGDSRDGGSRERLDPVTLGNYHLPAAIGRFARQKYCDGGHPCPTLGSFQEEKSIPKGKGGASAIVRN